MMNDYERYSFWHREILNNEKPKNDVEETSETENTNHFIINEDEEQNIYI